MSARYITIMITACFTMSYAEHTPGTPDISHVRSSQDLQVVAHQFPHLLYNAFMALNHDNEKDERIAAFQNAVNNIVNIASLVRSANELTGSDIDELLRVLDALPEEDIFAPEHPNTEHRVTIDTESFDAAMTRNAHIIAHNFPHLMLNTFIALNNDNDRTERHLAFYNAINNITNIASVIRSYQNIKIENIEKILTILDTALGEDNIELRFYDEAH